MTTPDSKLVSWCRKQLAGDLTEEGPIVRIELLHAADGVNAERLAVVRLQSQDPDDLATELWEAAENDAGTRMGTLPQRYVAASFRADAPEVVSAQWTFLLQGGSHRTKMVNLSDTYPASESGERGLVMHQTNRMHQLMYQMAEGMADRAAQDLQRERALRIRMEENHMKYLQLMEDLMDKKHQRELETARELAKEKRTEKVMKMGMDALPMLLSQFAPGLGASAFAKNAGIKNVLTGLTEKEVMGVINALEDEHKAAFFQLYASYVKEANQEESELHPLLREVPQVH
jgi:hypothetical protein